MQVQGFDRALADSIRIATAINYKPITMKRLLEGLFRSAPEAQAEPVQPPVDAAAEGVVEYLSALRVKGWATGRGGPATVTIYVNGSPIASGVANRFRVDVGSKVFEIEFSPPLSPSTDPASVDVRVDGIGPLAFWMDDRRVQIELPRKQVRERLRVPLYASPFVWEIADAEGWSDERRSMVREFAERGLLKIKLHRSDFEQLRKAIISEAGALYRGDVRVQDAWRDCPSVRALAIDEQIQDVLRDLYGREAIPMQTLNFWRGTEQSTHSDTVHFNSEPANFMCGVWVALESIGPHNGQLHYYPGSHRLPILNMDDIGVVTHEAMWDYNYQYHQEVLHEVLRATDHKKETVVAEPGEAIIWAANLAHGGEPIQQMGSTRHSQVTHYYFKGCSYFTPSLSNLPLGKFHRPDRRNIKTGEALEHQFEEIVLPHRPS